MALAGRMALGATAVLAIACAVQAASAATYCAPPTPPACVSRLIKSSVMDEFNNCRTNVIVFQTDANRYVECLRQAETDVMYDVEQSIGRFNRCANEGFCAGSAR